MSIMVIQRQDNINHPKTLADMFGLCSEVKVTG